MSFVARKTIELQRKLSGLSDDWTDWRERSKADGVLEKHHSQIRRILAVLEGLRERLELDLRQLEPNAEDVLGRCRRIERDVLAVHRVWGFFRGKFLLRDNPRYGRFLRAVNAFAVECYDAASFSVSRKRSDWREPPLVFLDHRLSPTEHARDSAYSVESTSDDDPIRERLSYVLKSLPVPLISIPWYQLDFFPDVLIVGHEVGHVVEEDFQLTATLSKLLDGGLDQAQITGVRRQAWHAWMGELFADLYGALATGPAFVGALADFLTQDPATIQRARRDPPNWGSYPTPTLRIQACCRALALGPFAKEGRQIEKEWFELYGGHVLEMFDDDVQPVVAALVDREIPELSGKSLRDVLELSANDFALGESRGERLLQGVHETSPSARVAFAAARLAYGRDPRKYALKMTRKLQQEFLEKVPLTKGVRETSSPPAGQEHGAQAGTPLRSDERHAELDRRLGHELFERLHASAEAPNSTTN